MLQFFAHLRRRRLPARAVRAPLTLEALEGRDCPATPGIAVTLNASIVSGTMVHLSGTVSAADPAGATVQIGGEVGSTVTTDSSGNFALDASATALGIITAQATDTEGDTSAVVETSLSCDAPVLAVTNALAADGVLTLSGQVTDLDGSGDVVTLTGAADGTAFTDADGNFSLSLTDWQVGDVTASTTDVWGQASNAAVTTVAAVAPTITQFSASFLSGTMVHLSGVLSAADPANCVVQLGGEVSTTVQPDSAGDFAVDVQAYGLGTVTATATDSHGLASSEVDTFLYCDAPVLTVTSAVDANGVLALSGHVTDFDGAGDVVTFSGAAYGSATTDDSGNFSLSLNDWSLGDVTASTSDVWGRTSDQATTNVTVSAPVITSVSASVISGTLIHLSGTLNDPILGQCVVQLGGEVSATVQPDADGNFAVDVPAAGLGTITVQACDSDGLTSSEFDVPLNCTAPVLTVTSAVDATGVMTLSGHVTDCDGGGDVVTFSGAADGTAVTDANGDFSLSVTNWNLGDVTATTNDVWGQASNAPTTTVSTSGPVIRGFQGIPGTLNTWTFQGQVLAPNAPGMVVRFDGLLSLQGQTATVQANGWFYLTVDLAGDGGTACAITTDPATGLTSNEAQTVIWQIN